MPGPIATLGSMHVCPMYSGTVPHVGGPVVGPGTPNILINGKPAAIMGDKCTCVGPPDVIAQGAPSVFFNGIPVACIGDMTAHGGVITSGEPNVVIGNATSTPSVTLPLNKIPFPSIGVINRILGNTKEAQANQDQLKEASENQNGEPRIFNLQWIKEEKVIRDSQVLKEVTLQAHVQNVPEGSSVSFTISKPPSKEEQNVEANQEVTTLTGTVQDKKVSVVWEIEDPTQQEEEHAQ